MCLLKPKSFIIDFFLFAKLLELLAVNHSASERRVTFVHVLVVGVHLLIVELDNPILFSALSRIRVPVA